VAVAAINGPTFEPPLAAWAEAPLTRGAEGRANAAKAPLKPREDNAKPDPDPVPRRRVPKGEAAATAVAPCEQAADALGGKAPEAAIDLEGGAAGLDDTPEAEAAQG
jgi:hypothetical protein